eukprot:CAMPEP_0118660902 /NCGR_PEP_ID=MMETSP0785-20121206/15964_1 /TAXON_ID=91992 /ORGANISM="Bolidomonas pacifica, Strain CCMP 1866" /LENGTH=272 /DNA_ID=CAMNT_0006554247 /DNA_START=53 /DNA_END=868 /DNA_ORIENTATION=-
MRYLPPFLSSILGSTIILTHLIPYLTPYLIPTVLSLNLVPSPTNSYTVNLSPTISIISPLHIANYPSTRPPPSTTQPSNIVLYLPGVDCTLLSPFMQFPELSSTFKASVYGLKISPSDRTPYNTLTEIMTSYVSSLLQSPACTNLYIMGESFGSLVLLTLLTNLSSLPPKTLSKLSLPVLINPATSYPRSNLRSTLSKILSLPPYLHPVLLPSTLPLFVDFNQILSLILIISSRYIPSPLCTREREAYMGRVATGLWNTIEYMDRDTMKWRV